ncbi:hypothetical protein GCWU000324_02863 [Kingella oralis ATCC 51147]|uniref:Uncharacterized protein n=1 Tax=Kingella oralis ATCC 51147 TaxID=629741 RepID=C4GMD0_9NEIS|nr:hypothetical protein GCWU000324_02863 [Kingella oralis ATCC 51147]
MFLQLFLNIKQDSRLRGNDGISYFSGCLRLLRVCLLVQIYFRQPENAISCFQAASL